MKNFNSYNKEPKVLAEIDEYGNQIFEKEGTSLDNIDFVSRGRNFVTPKNYSNDQFKKISLQDRLYDGYSEGSGYAPISSILEMDRGRFTFTHAGFMGLLEINNDNKAELKGLFDMSDCNKDFNPYEGIVIGQETKNGNIPLRFSILNDSLMGAEIIGDDSPYDRFNKNINRQIMNYYKNNK